MTDLEDPRCVICNLVLVHDVRRELAVPKSEIIYGPGSKDQYHTVDKGYHCPSCGIQYARRPVKKDK